MMDLRYYFEHSNLFNFAVMILLFVWVAKKAKLGDAMRGAVANIADTIEKSEHEKRAANKALKAAQKALSAVEGEAKSLMANAKLQAKTFTQKILAQTKEKIALFESVVKKAVTAEERVISARLTKLAAQKSVELAHAEILAALKKNPKLHEEFIKESIKQL